MAAFLMVCAAASAQPGYGYPHGPAIGSRPDRGGVVVTRGYDTAVYGNSFGLGYGANSIWEMSAAGAMFKNMITIGKDEPFTSFHSSGTFNLDYYHNLLPFLEMGAIFNYGWGTGMTEVRGRDVTFHAVSLLLAAKFDWVELGWLSFYSKLGLGVTNVSAAGERQQLFDWQCSPVGLELGGLLRFYTEVGFGAQGLFQVGARYCF